MIELFIMTIGFGTAAIGRPQYINLRSSSNSVKFNKEKFSEEGEAILTAAYQKGVRHFDTAPGYGIAEQIIIDWIRKHQPQNITVSSKWGYSYVANFNHEAKVHEIKEHSLEKLNEQWAKSKQLLPQLNIYQIHSATLDSGVLDNKSILQRLHEIKQQYKIKIGLSTSGESQNEIIEKALKIRVNKQDLFDSYQVTYNVFDQNLLKIKNLLVNQNKCVIIKEALANGRIFPNRKYKNYSSTYQILKQLAAKYKVNEDAIALRFCIDTIQPSTVLSGAINSAQLTSNLDALKFELSTLEIDQIKALSSEPSFYWEERKLLPWN